MVERKRIVFALWHRGEEMKAWELDETIRLTEQLYTLLYNCWKKRINYTFRSSNIFLFREQFLSPLHKRYELNLK